GRELLIKNLSLETSEKDSALDLGEKFVANLVIRSSSIALSFYNPVSLPFFTVSNPLIAIGKGYRACVLYTQGKVYEDQGMIDEAKKKTLEVAKHVALSVIDIWLLGFVDSYSSSFFGIAAIGYTLVGTILDLTRSSEKVHDKLFFASEHDKSLDPDYIEPDGDDSDDEDYDPRTEKIYPAEVRDLRNDAGEDWFEERDRVAASSASRPGEFPREDDDYFPKGGEEVERRASRGPDDFPPLYESEEEDSDYDDDVIGFAEDDSPSEEISFSDEERESSLFETPYMLPRSGNNSLLSPIGNRENSFIEGVEVEDNCDDTRTSGSMRLRSPDAMRRSDFFSPSRFWKRN
ncbi:MAG: hypothetical protein K1060chlam4_00814, partial [Candidatus Anoxychlamydiales bacterium]|nr:hypothetical protein [Candidatus Anoxychlamydiales bacterium]NGX44708.1 hypothetical protein [Candidatus Anoxychlamydiales bacterium]